MTATTMVEIFLCILAAGLLARYAVWIFIGSLVCIPIYPQYSAVFIILAIVTFAINMGRNYMDINVH